MAAGAPRRTPPAREDLLAETVALSRRFGADPEFVRAGGGNISAKADGILAIKPSGVSLATLTVEALIELSVAPLLDALAGDAGIAIAPGSDEVLRVGEAARLSGADGRRPSVELLFHALLPEPIVLHTHPTTVNTLTCSASGPELAGQILRDRALWIPYADPGLPLARSIKEQRSAYEGRTGRRAPRAILLQNHGLIVSGDSAAEIDDLSRGVVARIEEHAAGLPAFSWGGVKRIDGPLARDVVAALGSAIGRQLENGETPRAVAFDDSPLALGVASSELGHRLAVMGPLTPDQIVYAGSWPLIVDAFPLDERAALAAVAAFEAALAERAARGVDPPIVVLAASLGVFTVGDSDQQAETARELYLDSVRIASGAHRLGGVRPLAPRERQFIELWEAEAYRRQVASQPT